MHNSAVAINLEDVTLTLSSLAGPVNILAGVSLRVAAGETVALLGPSGSGKSSLLMVAAGLEAVTSGRIQIAGTDITSLGEDALARFRRGHVGIVFQSFHLIQTMTALENVAVPLELAGIRDAFDRAGAELEAVGLKARMDHYPGQLSGGEQQRVALARALVIEPDVLLMDEPLGALDRQLRKTVQLELRRLHEAHRRTTIYVTHDQEEALVLSDRVAVMREARVVQIGTAAELYTAPEDAFVAAFIGESNLLPARVVALERGIASVEVAGLASPLRAVASPGVAIGRPARLLIRPEHLRLGAADGVAGTIEEIVYLGELVAVRVALESGAQLWARRFADGATGRGVPVSVGWAAEHLRVVADS